jgi:predicted nuclease with TOPRIM domain
MKSSTTTVSTNVQQL